MIALDSSSLIRFFAGESGSDVDIVSKALHDKVAVLPPVVLTELVSDPEIPQQVAELLELIPVIPLKEGYWKRAGRSRGKLLKEGLKAPLADSLIAQSCLDHALPLVTADKDFRSFEKFCKLSVLP